MAKDRAILQNFDTAYEQAYYAWDPYFPLAERDLRFFLGDQWDEREKRELFQQGRSTFVFNRIRRNINLVTGYQRKHRLSSVVVPFEKDDQQTADQLSQCLLHSMNYTDGYQVISDCFAGALKTGWNLATLWMDYRDDPVNGDIRICREPYNGFIVDPYLSKLDLSDCNYILRRKYLSKEQAISLLPKRAKDIEQIHAVGWDRDDKFTWLPYQRQPSGEQLLAYNEMYEQKWMNAPTLVNLETGQVLDIDGTIDREILKNFQESHPEVTIITRPKRYIEKHIIINDVVLDSVINPYGLDEYPFVPFTAIWEPESDQWGLKVQSLIRCMVDPQRESNRRRSQMVDLLDSQINSGYIADENSVVNPSSLFQSSQGKVIWRREDAKPGAIEKIQPAQIPPSMFQLQEVFDRDMMEIAGVNDAAFGQTENAGESGIMMMLRQGASIVNLQELFDNLRKAQKCISQKMIKLMQQWKPAKVERVINEAPTAEFYDPKLSKYDIVVQEGILTDTQRQMYFRQLVDLKQLGVPVTGEMLARAAPIQGKGEFLEELQHLEQSQAQQAQQQQQIQAQLLDSQRQMSQAKAISDIALSKERFTRAVANMGLEDERSSAAVENRADFALKRAKAIKELETMDDDRLLKYLSLVQMMEQSARVQEERVKEDDINISARGAEQPQQPNIPEVGGLLQELPQQQPSEVQNG